MKNNKIKRAACGHNEEVQQSIPATLTQCLVCDAYNIKFETTDFPDDFYDHSNNELLKKANDEHTRAVLKMMRKIKKAKKGKFKA